MFQSMLVDTQAFCALGNRISRLLSSQLRLHASGDTQWLKQLDEQLAAGAALPSEFQLPQLAKPGGPAAVPLLLLYRRDWWRRLAELGTAEDLGVGSALPSTWSQLLPLLRALLNRDLDGDGAPDHVLCADLHTGCKGWAVLSAVFASLAQTQGTEQGLWFNTSHLTFTTGDCGWARMDLAAISRMCL